MNRMKKIVAATVCTAALAMPATGFAQVTDQWQFGAQLYLWLPSISGSSNFPASGSSPSLNVDSDNILDSLNSAFMGSFEARKGRWGGFTDVAYVDLGADKSGTRDFAVGGIGIPSSASGDLHYDLRGTVWTIAGEYIALSTPTTTTDFFAGARLADLHQKVNWSLSGDIGGIPLSGRTGSSDVSRSNWDAIVGVKGKLRFGGENRWFVPYYVDIGGGDSDLTWQAMAGVGYSWQWGDVVAAYRYLKYDFGSGKPFEDLTLNGPAISVVFRW